MIGIGSMIDDLLDSRAQLYLISFVLIQLVIQVIAFEFLRKPWEGQEVELERVLELEQNKLLEGDISEMTMNEDLFLSCRIGKGSYGEVWRGVVRGRGTARAIDVAAKVVPLDGNNIGAVQHEVELQPQRDRQLTEHRVGVVEARKLVELCHL